METVTFDCKRIKGEVRVPVSKSILHRYLVCAYTEGHYDAIRNIENIVSSAGFEGELPDDVVATRDCLLDVIDGKDTLNCHESGTTLRFIIPLAAALGRNVKIVAKGSLIGRPMKEFIDELNRHGTEIKFSADGIFEVSGKLEAGDYELPGNISSQFVSALLLVASVVDGDLWIAAEDEFQSMPYIEMTEKIISAYDMGRAEKMIEGDWSAGAMWAVINDILGGKLRISGLKADSIQGDKVIIDILNEYAIQEVYGEDEIAIDASDYPDIVPAIALRAVASPMKTTINGIERLKYKESNRIVGIADILSLLGADIDIVGESLVIRGKGDEAALVGTTDIIDTRGDHRLVMLAALASVLTIKPVTVAGYESVRKSYPNFIKDIGKLEGLIYK